MPTTLKNQNPRAKGLQSQGIRKRRGTFHSRFGFYMAAVGSALGLGTLWRFPYITGTNGGGAFVLLYVFFVAGIGLPALTSELMLGKLTRRNIVGAFYVACLGWRRSALALVWISRPRR